MNMVYLEIKAAGKFSGRTTKFELNFCAIPNVPFLLSALGHAATKCTAFRNLVMKTSLKPGLKMGMDFRGQF